MPAIALPITDVSTSSNWQTWLYGAPSYDISNPPAPVFYAPQAAERALLNPTGDLSTLTGDAIAESAGYYKQSIKDFFTSQSNVIDNKTEEDKKSNETWLMIGLIGLGVVAVVKL